MTSSYSRAERSSHQLMLQCNKSLCFVGVQLEGLRPDGWTMRLLMFAALNAPVEDQVELLTRVLADSRLAPLLSMVLVC